MNHNTAGAAGVLRGFILAAEARSEVGVVACGKEVPAPKVRLGGDMSAPWADALVLSEAVGERIALMR